MHVQPAFAALVSHAQAMWVTVLGGMCLWPRPWRGNWNLSCCLERGLQSLMEEDEDEGEWSEQDSEMEELSNAAAKV